MNLRSLLGILALIALAWAFSENRKKFPWRIALTGLGLQIALAFFILKTSFGRDVFDWGRLMALGLLDFAKEGGRLVFGALGDEAKMAEAFGPESGFVLAISVVTTIVLISALSAALYHWGLLQRVVGALAKIMKRIMGASGAETLSSVANVFMGQTEAPLLVKPYIPRLTRSELLALMTGGMATIAGSVLVVYVSLAPEGDDLAGHLLTASVLSAPGALMFAKILIPESETPETAPGATLSTEKTATNTIDAICAGASDGMKLSLNVIACLIAFVGIIALLNALVSSAIGSVASAFGRPIAEPVTIQDFMALCSLPFAWLMGVAHQDLWIVSKALGERIVLNEFLGYLRITESRDALDPRSFTIASYALCGFANFGSIAIQIGGISALAPDRRGDLANLGLRAMFAGLLACYLTASIVGLWI